MHVQFVGLASHLKVVHVAQVVVFYVFGEVEHDIVACSQDTVFRLGSAENHRPTSVLDSVEHLRLIGDEVVSVSAEDYGAKVV